MKAYLALDSLRDPSGFKAWIYRIGHNTFLNTCRGFHPVACSLAPVADTVAASDTADAAFRYQALYDALDSIPASERTSLLLFYMEGYSVKGIAAIVDASPGAIRQHLSRGRTRLRHLLTPNT